MDDPASNERVETRTPGFDKAPPPPATPSDRAQWDPRRHEEALRFHRQQNERAGMGDPGRRNQYCPSCRGVVDWRAERCPHCQAPIPSELRDYYNFSDFEPPVDRRDIAPLLTVFALALVALAALGAGLFWVARWLLC